MRLTFYSCFWRVHPIGIMSLCRRRFLSFVPFLSQQIPAAWMCVFKVIYLRSLMAIFASCKAVSSIFFTRFSIFIVFQIKKCVREVFIGTVYRLFSSSTCTNYGSSRAIAIQLPARSNKNKSRSPERFRLLFAIPVVIISLSRYICQPIRLRPLYRLNRSRQLYLQGSYSRFCRLTTE